MRSLGDAQYEVGGMTDIIEGLMMLQIKLFTPHKYMKKSCGHKESQ